MDIRAVISEYLSSVDSALESLSHGNEGYISKLPSWVLETRKIVIGVTDDNEGLAINITPDPSLENDEIEIVAVLSQRDISQIIAPMNYQGAMPNRGPEKDFVLIADMTVVEDNNPLAVPIVDSNCVIGWGRMEGFLELFHVDKAKEEAISLWNNAVQDVKKGSSFVLEARNSFNKLQAIIRRRAFLERKIHRFINQYSELFLPNHKNCFFEEKLFLNDDFRKADFILEREGGLPPLLIELEAPTHKVFTKKGDLTAQANHASQQITEWVSYIERDPIRNASGNKSFLTGPKEKLVIIGRGLEDREKLIETKFGGTTFWTYSLMLEEARNRWNNHIASQYKLLGLEEVRPF